MHGQERAVFEAGRTIDLDAIPFRPGDRVDVLQVRTYGRKDVHASQLVSVSAALPVYYQPTL